MHMSVWQWLKMYIQLPYELALLFAYFCLSLLLRLIYECQINCIILSIALLHKWDLLYATTTKKVVQTKTKYKKRTLSTDKHIKSFTSSARSTIWLNDSTEISTQNERENNIVIRSFKQPNNQTNTIDQDKRVLIYFGIVVACKFQMSTFWVRKIIFELSLIWILFCLEY